MKSALKIALVFLCLCFISASICAQTSGQTQPANPQPHARHVYTNDDFPPSPETPTPAPAGSSAATGDRNASGTKDGANPDEPKKQEGAAATADDKSAATGTDKAAAGDKPAGDKSAKDDQTAADDKKKQLEADLNKKAADAKQQISLLEREIDIDERENKLQTAQFYADAGSRLRDPQKFADDQRKAQADIDKKKDQLATQKKTLADVEEQARRAGIRLQ